MGKVLVLNTGSSSVKFALYDEDADALTIRGAFTRLGTRWARLSVERFFGGPQGLGDVIDEQPTTVRSVDKAIPAILDLLLKEERLTNLAEITLVAHRVVHGGGKYDAATLINEEVKRDIKAFARFAPLHNPHNLKGIERCEHLLHGVPQAAVFDTAFHHTLPETAYRYGIDRAVAEKLGIRKYGFHGTNHKYCAHTAASWLGAMPRRMIVCHLGNGSSITAIRDGQSIETSMGFTPLDGVIMGTRPGSLDPGVVLRLLDELHSSEKLNTFLNTTCGLQGLAGTGDVEQLWSRACRGDSDARFALERLAHDITHYVGAYAAVLNGLDCLVFTGGIGENAWYVRSEVCKNLGHLGVLIDTEKNQANEHDLSAPGARVKTFVIKANEELQIAREASRKQ